MSFREKGLYLGSLLLFLLLQVIRLLLEGSHYCNSNVGFSLFPRSTIFVVVEIILLALVLWCFKRSTHFSDRVIFSILFVGGFSNFFERVVFGCVLDYLTLPLIGSSVNGADILITFSLGYLLIVRREDIKF
jgi:lipoprotein signal peptidase